MAPPLSSMITSTSPDRSLFATHLHKPPTSSDESNWNRIAIKCYDAKHPTRGGGAGGGGAAPRCTLVATASSASSDDAEVDEDAGPIFQLVFSRSSSGDDGPSYLTAVRSTSALLFDLNRGVHDKNAVELPPRTAVAGAVCGEDTLYLLCFSSEGEAGSAGAGGSSSRKTFVLEYSLGGGSNKPRRKIKAGTVATADSSEMGIGLNPEGSTLAIRHPGQVRLIDVDTGKRLHKIKLDSSSSSSVGKEMGGEGDVQTIPVVFSPDGKLVVTPGGAEGVVAFDVQSGERYGPALILSVAGDDVAAAVRSIDVALTVAAKDEEEEEGSYAVLLTSADGTASLYKLSSSADDEDSSTSPVATFHCRTPDSTNVAQVAFHGTFPTERVSALLMSSGAGAGVEVCEAPYDLNVGGDDDEEEATTTVIKLGSTGTDDEEKKEAVSGGTGESAESAKKISTKTNKRVLGPGESGGEALGASDVVASSKEKKAAKRRRKEDEEEGLDFELPEDDEGEEGEEEKATIAARLAMLSETLDASSSEEEEDDEDMDSDEEDEEEDERKKAAAAAMAAFQPKTATTESLATILIQALRSNDDGQLEVALRVKDKRVIESSVRALRSRRLLEETTNEEGEGGTPAGGESLVVALLGKLATRLARRPNRAVQLGFWVRSVLSALVVSPDDDDEDGNAVGRMGPEELDAASRLGPLRNLLKERVECFPHLLRLEGRLALLGRQA